MCTDKIGPPRIIGAHHAPSVGILMIDPIVFQPELYRKSAEPLHWPWVKGRWTGKRRR
ncbi:MAG: hypothetical protein ABJH45_19190 [Paracoccaceae bacterium]